MVENSIPVTSVIPRVIFFLSGFGLPICEKKVESTCFSWLMFLQDTQGPHRSSEEQ